MTSEQQLPGRSTVRPARDPASVPCRGSSQRPVSHCPGSRASNSPSQPDGVAEEGPGQAQSLAPTAG